VREGAKDVRGVGASIAGVDAEGFSAELCDLSVVLDMVVSLYVPL
jgi:hypothetical protein